MGAIKRAIDKYCQVTNSKLIDYHNDRLYFVDSWGEEKSYSRKELSREVGNFK
ncbi:hypothetical protein M3197_12515 [Sporosarcina aquimarina]|uniref:hypothetical protein n=1 Tax=Sporosarcina aquimarina TaxID=114975 RepID=UPI00203DE764|nr:hypothetical protein [Sporosarcina aquimarina]MCM3758285.1 hypothetical protein [Sporosarcina aquimarina]